MKQVNQKSKKARAVSKRSPANVHIAEKASTRKLRSRIVATVHETSAGLHAAGAVSTKTMREFDALCIDAVEPMGARQIAELRRREKVSQPVFAAYLNVSKSSVAQWESGAKRPDGPALKLLNVVKKNGLHVLA